MGWGGMGWGGIGWGELGWGSSGTSSSLPIFLLFGKYRRPSHLFLARSRYASSSSSSTTTSSSPSSSPSCSSPSTSLPVRSRRASSCAIRALMASILDTMRTTPTLAQPLGYVSSGGTSTRQPFFAASYDRPFQRSWGGVGWGGVGWGGVGWGRWGGAGWGRVGWGGIGWSGMG